MDRRSTPWSVWEAPDTSLDLTSAQAARDSSDAPETIHERGQPIVKNSIPVQAYTSTGGGPTLPPLALSNTNTFMQDNFMVDPYGYHSVPMLQAQDLRNNHTFQAAAGRNTIDDTAYSSQVQLPAPIFTANSVRNNVSRPKHPWSLVPAPTQGAYGDNDVLPPWQMDLGSVYYDTQAHKYYYRCYICSKGSIGRLQDLKRHVQHLHGNQVIACKYPGCEQLLPKARPDYLRRHVEKDHGPRGALQQ